MEMAIRINLDKMPVKMGPGKEYPTNGEVHKGDSFKITEEKNGFGHLKSNAGWIEMKWCEKIK